MKKLLLLTILLITFSCNSKKEKTQTVEIACGQCQFGMTSQNGCDLAIKINDKAYFVDGLGIDDFGDAHAEGTGFCEVIRTAKVSGEVVDSRFIASSIDIIEKH